MIYADERLSFEGLCGGFVIYHWTHEGVMKVDGKWMRFDVRR